MNDRLFFGYFDALDLFQLFNARLHLFCLGCLGAEAVDKCLKVLNLNALTPGPNPAPLQPSRTDSQIQEAFS